LYPVGGEGLLRDRRGQAGAVGEAPDQGVQEGVLLRHHQVPHQAIVHTRQALPTNLKRLRLTEK
jgi:hypothetical protein